MQVPLVELRRHDTDGTARDVPFPPVADLGNVVPFRRPNARLAEHPTPAEIIAPAERLLPAARGDRRRALLFVLLVASFALHVALLAVLSRAPPPLPGIELAPITVEIVVSDGARPDSGAGATTPNEEPKGQQEPQQDPKTTQSPPETESKPPEEPPPQVSEPEHTQASEPPATPPEAPVTDRTPPEDKGPAPEAPPEPAQQPPVAEQPQPTEAAPAPPEPTVPTQPREQTEKSQTERKVAAPPPPPKQKPPQSAEPPRLKQTPARESQRHPEGRPDGKTRANEAGARPSSAASARRSSADPNYGGTVLAQLSRHKRMPAEAQRNHSQGMAIISFTIDGSGRAGAVRLTRSSGVAILDQEALGLPRRASPFPPPPGGRPQPITVPLNFRF